MHEVVVVTSYQTNTVIVAFTISLLNYVINVTIEPINNERHM